MVKKRDIIFISIIATLSVVVFFLSGQGRKTEVKEIVRTDTITITKYDTITLYKPRFVKEVIVDTIEVEIIENNPLKLPKTQRFYSNPNYNLWISGYKPELDSLQLFKTTEYIYINNDIEKTIRKYDVYGGLEYGRFNNQDLIMLNLTLDTPSGFGIQGGVGVMNGDVGFTIGLRKRILSF